MRFAMTVALVLLTCQSVRANVPIRSGVEGQALAANVERTLQAFQFLGAPFSKDIAAELSTASKNRERSETPATARFSRSGDRLNQSGSPNRA